MHYSIVESKQLFKISFFESIEFKIHLETQCALTYVLCMLCYILTLAVPSLCGTMCLLLRVAEETDSTYFHHTFKMVQHATKSRRKVLPTNAWLEKANSYCAISLDM